MSALAERPATAASSSRTGLALGDLHGLTDADASALARWHAGKAGGEPNDPWWPAAIRRMPVASRLELAVDPVKDAVWEERERRRVRESVGYLVAGYGSIQPESGPAIPFDLWPTQVPVLRTFEKHLRVAVLKARQLGLTWLALHYAVWLLAFNDATPNARVLCLSKVGDDAQKLLGRARDIIRRLPPYLRPTESRDSRDSVKRMKLEGRGEMLSLTSSPDAARMETATLVLLDEFAHVRNRKASDVLTAVLPTLGRLGKLIVIFTGNGPAEAPGNGQAAARLWNRARSGSAEDDGRGFVGVFLPDSAHPERDEAWRAAKREEFLTPEEFAQEHPLTEEEALAGQSGGKVFGAAGLNAAVALGREFDALLEAGDLVAPLDGATLACADFGEMPAAYVLWPLEGGGFYVTPSEVAPDPGPEADAMEVARSLMDHVQRWQRQEGDRGPWPPIGRFFYDGAGVQSARGFVRFIEQIDMRTGRQDLGRARVSQWRCNVKPWRGRRVLTVPTYPVQFNLWKTTGRRYLERLVKRTGDGEDVQVIAISPRNTTLIRQLRGLERKDDGSGEIEKGDDHGPDALIAGVTKAAATWLGKEPPRERDISASAA